MKNIKTFLTIMIALISLGVSQTVLANTSITQDSEVIIQPSSYLTVGETDEFGSESDDPEYTYPDNEYIEEDSITGEYQCIEGYETFIEDDGTIICSRYEVEVEEAEEFGVDANEQGSDIIPGSLNYNLGGGVMGCSLTIDQSALSYEPLAKGLIFLTLSILLLFWLFRSYFMPVRSNKNKKSRVVAMKTNKLISKIFSLFLGLFIVFNFSCSNAEKSMEPSPDQIITSTNESSVGESSGITGLPGIYSESEIIIIEPKESCMAELPPPPNPECNTPLHQRVPYDSQGALIIRYNDLLNSLLVKNAVETNPETQESIDYIESEINRLLSTLGLSKQSTDIEVVAVGGNASELTAEAEFDLYFIVKFYSNISETDFDALRLALADGSLTFTADYETDLGTVTTNTAISMISDENGEIRINLSYSDSEGDSYEYYCDFETQFISCGTADSVDQLKFVREGSLAAIYQTEKVEFMGCNTVEMFIETGPIIQFAESEGVTVDASLESTYGDGLVEITLNVYNAVETTNRNSVFGYGQLVVAYWQENEWHLGLTLNMSDRFLENIVTNFESLSELFESEEE